MKRYITFLLIATSLTFLTGCGQYQGWVRYPCQEYKNWDKPECNPPQCLSTGTCTKDIFPEGMIDEQTEIK